MGLGLFGLLIIALASLWWMRDWRGNSRVTLVVGEGEQMGLVSIDPVQNQVVSILIHPDTRMPLVGGYGEYVIGVVPRLGQQEGLGNELLVSSMEHWFGVDIVGVSRRVRVGEGGFAGMGWRFVMEGIGQEFGVGDRLALVWWVWQTKAADFTAIDLLADNYLSPVVRPDGSTQYELGEAVIDRLALAYLQDLSLRTSEHQVVVLNGTSESGLAGEFGRLLSNIGYDVVSIADSRLKENETVVLVDSGFGEYQEYVESIEGIFPVSVQVKQGVLEEYTANVVVVLGEDYARFLSENWEKQN